MTRIQALRMAAANKLRKRIDYDLSCRLSPEGDLTAWRRATPDERRVCGRRVRHTLPAGFSYFEGREIWVDRNGHAIPTSEALQMTRDGGSRWLKWLK